MPMLRLVDAAIFRDLCSGVETNATISLYNVQIKYEVRKGREWR